MKRDLTSARRGHCASLRRQIYLGCFLTVTATLATFTTHANTMKVAELADLSLEQLGDIVVTTVSRRAQPLESAAAAIYIIRAEDIRRTGVTSLPEALRLAPNLQVARTDTNQYAISARGFNNPIANRLLVMIDGRTIYSPLFSGVFWDVQDVMLEDVERIEVISGPGATLWGANAVNGVINIITRRAGDTQGILATVGVGNLKQTASVRQGGHFGDDGYYRVYARHTTRSSSERRNGASAMDESERAQVGFRTEWGGVQRNYKVQGDAYEANIDQRIGGARHLRGANLMARWKEQYDDGSFWRVQTFYDHAQRDQPGSFQKRLDTLDVEFQHGGIQPSLGHSLLWGAGYRYAKDDLSDINPDAFNFIPEDRELHWYHFFMQDDWNLRPGLTATLGLKGEHNSYTGLEWLPNARVAWRYAQNRLIWAAISRAIRAPSRLDRDFYSPGRPPYTLAGGSNFESEVSEVYELGYRTQPTEDLSFTATAFYHDHKNLRTMEATSNGNVFANNMEGNTDGIEFWGTYRIADNWRLDAGWTELRQHRRAKAGSMVPTGAFFVGNDPRRSLTLRSLMDITPRFEFDLIARYVGELPDPAVAAYSAVDARFGWEATKNLQLSLLLQNLFDDSHSEWNTAATAVEFDRGIYLKLIWRS